MGRIFAGRWRDRCIPKVSLELGELLTGSRSFRVLHHSESKLEKVPATGLAYSSAALSPLAYKGVSLLEGRVLLLGVSSEVTVRDTLIAAGRAVSCINFLPDKLWEVMARAVYCCMLNFQSWHQRDVFRL